MQVHNHRMALGGSSQGRHGQMEFVGKPHNLADTCVRCVSIFVHCMNLVCRKHTAQLLPDSCLLTFDTHSRLSQQSCDSVGAD